LFIIAIIRRKRGRRGAEQNLRLVIVAILRKGPLVLSIAESIPSNTANEPILLIRIRANIIPRPYRYKPRCLRNRSVVYAHRILVV
jgi:hypothetical protein